MARADVNKDTGRKQLSNRLRPLKRVEEIGGREWSDGFQLSFTDLMALLLIFFVLFFSLSRPLPDGHEAQPLINRVNGKINTALYEQLQADEKKESILGRLLSAAPAWANSLISDEAKERRAALEQVGQGLESAGRTDLTDTRLGKNEYELLDHLLGSTAKPGTGLSLQEEGGSPRSREEGTKEQLMARLEALRETMPGFDLDLQAKEDAVVMVIGDRVTFEEGLAEIKPEFREMLLRLAITLHNGATKIAGIRIQGHTDARPISNDKYPSNWELSAARAASVARLLIQQGFDPRLFEIAGYSEYRPVAPNSSESERALNRRVEIELSMG